MATRGEKPKSESIGRGDMDARPQTERKHPEPWEDDLSPDRMAGQSIGFRSAEQDEER
jgi:hypothetical protein